jgi:hypothetical protein
LKASALTSTTAVALQVGSVSPRMIRVENNGLLYLA